MKLLRHMLSHLFLIVFFIAVISIFYYRTLLLPNNVVEKIDTVVMDVYPPALSFVSKRDYFWSISGQRIVSFDSSIFIEKEAKVEDQRKPSAMAEDDVEEGISLETESKNSVEVKKEVEKTDVTLSNEHKILEMIIEKEPVVETNEVEASAIVVNDSNTSSERDLLISARNAFNQGRVEQSEIFYIELTQLDNDNPDAFGELGNVYYSQGKWDKAGLAYYEAAVRLITEKNYEQVAYLQRVIKGLNMEHAEKLAQLMMRR